MWNRGDEHILQNWAFSVYSWALTLTSWMTFGKLINLLEFHLRMGILIVSAS